MPDTGGPPLYITTPQGSSVTLVAQLIHSVLSLLLYMTSLFIQIFYIIDSGLFWNSLWNNYNIARFISFRYFYYQNTGTIRGTWYCKGILEIQIRVDVKIFSCC